MRKYIYFLFFISLMTPIKIVAQQNHIIPRVKITLSKKNTPSFTAGPKNIITQQSLQRAGITSLVQALQNLGGVQIHDTTGNQSQVLLSMRGFGANANNNTLVLVNGIPLTNPDLAAPDLTTIPIEEINYIEIIPGSESVLFGDQAVGGVINIVTRGKTAKSALSCITGSDGLYHCYAIFHHTNSHFNGNTLLSNQHTDNYRDHNQFDQQSLLGHVIYSYSTGRINFNYQLANEAMQYPGALTRAQVFQNRRQATNSTDFFKNWNGLFHIQHQQNLNQSWQLQTDIARREMHGHGTLTAPFTQSRSSYFLKPQIKGSLENNLFAFGIDLQQDHYRLISLLGKTDNAEDKYGIFGVTTFPFHDIVSFSIGARGARQHNHLISFTTNDAIHRAFATTLGFTLAPTSSFHFYLRRAGSFRFPKADETTFGIGSLRTQQGVAYESGLEIDKETYAGKMEIYQLNLNDEIAFDPLQTPQQPFGSNRNLDPTKRQGLSLSARIKIGTRLEVDSQYHWVNAKFQNGPHAGNRIPLVSENRLRAGIDYLIAENWHIYTEAIHTGNQYADSDDANVAGKIGGYTIYNLNLNYHLKNLEVAFHANNIFNKYYYIYTVYQSSTATEFFYPAPDRNVMLSVKYEFA